MVLILNQKEVNAYAYKFRHNGQWYGNWIETQASLTPEEEVAAKQVMVDLAGQQAEMVGALAEVELIWWKGNKEDVGSFLRPE